MPGVIGSLQGERPFAPTKELHNRLTLSLWRSIGRTSRRHPGFDPGSGLLINEVRGWGYEVGRATEAGLPFKGSPFSEKNDCKFQDARRRKETLS